MAQNPDAFYKDMQGIADGLLNEFRQATFKLVRTPTAGGPKYNPGSGQPVKYTFKGGTLRGVSKKYVDGKDIIGTDLQASLSVAQIDEAGAPVDPSVRPTISDKLEINGVSYSIIADKSVPPAGVVVTYIIVIRK